PLAQFFAPADEEWRIGWVFQQVHQASWPGTALNWRDTMARLSGKWTLQAIGNDAGWQQRIVISGSLAHDGPHVMTLGTSIAHVAGQDIEITAQALNPNSTTWVNSLVQDVMNWDNASGLQVRLNIEFG